jgi:hypothetical protein
MNCYRLIIALFFTGGLFGQGYVAIGARENGLGSTGVTSSNANSYFYNPGSIGNVKSLEIAINYQNRFLLREFSEQSLSAALPLKKGVISFGMYHAGNKLYQNTRLGAGYSLELAKHLFMGVQFNYQGILLPDYYGKSSKLTGEFGVLYNQSEHWQFGVAIFNFSNSKLSNYQDDRLSSLLKIGATYQPSKIVSVIAEINKDLEVDSPYLNFGIEYQPINILFLRVGVGTQPSNFGFGFGYRFKSIQIDLSSRYHQTLGFIPQVGIKYLKK